MQKNKTHLHLQFEKFADLCDNSWLQLNITSTNEMVGTVSTSRTWYHLNIFDGDAEFSSTSDETLSTFGGASSSSGTSPPPPRLWIQIQIVSHTLSCTGDDGLLQLR